MLVLTRRPNEEVVFPATDTVVRVLDVKRGAVRLGIEAPPEVQVLRGELQGRPPRKAAARPAPTARAVAPEDARFRRQLLDRLKATAAGLGLLQLQMDAGLVGEARATLTAVRDDFRLLRLGAEGEWEPGPAPRKAARPRRALLVEDDRNERELLASFLRHSGLEVDTAGDGCDALDYLRARGRPDVVLLDMGMPRCDGAATVRRIRGDHAYDGLKIFAVTGHLPGEFDLPSGPAGVNRWFHKPLDPAALVRDLNRELAAEPCGV